MFKIFMTAFQHFRDNTPRDAYGAFEHRARSDAAKKLVEHLNDAIIRTETRKRQRKAADAQRFYETLERFVGELLQAKARQGKGGTGRFGRAMSTRGFSGDIVSYDNVRAVRDGLKKLGYLIHTKGYPNFHLSFDNPDGYAQGKGEAAKFEASPSLVELASEHGVSLSKVHGHFGIERQPIEARRSSISDCCLLRNVEFKSYIVKTAQGAASQAAITLDAIRGYEFKLPLLPEQLRIASILGAYDDLLEVYDDLLEVNRRRIVLLEEMARQIFDEWFIRFRFPGYEDLLMAHWNANEVRSAHGVVRKVAYLHDWSACVAIPSALESVTLLSFDPVTKFGSFPCCCCHVSRISATLLTIACSRSRASAFNASSSSFNVLSRS
jgi:hypothetical protein